MSCFQNSVAVDPITFTDAVAAANLNTVNIVGLVDKHPFEEHKLRLRKVTRRTVRGFSLLKLLSPKLSISTFCEAINIDAY